MFTLGIYEDKSHHSLFLSLFCAQISLRIFNEVEKLCRHIRRNSTVFGGIQVIVCGDFYQLNPVPDMLHGDAGDSVSLSKYVQTMHHVDLKNVQRQQCAKFIQAVHEVATGDVSALLNWHVVLTT